MGTRSYIGKDIGNGKYSVIFCQLESYLETTGRLLTEHYNTPEKVDALLALGDICFLGEKNRTRSVAAARLVRQGLSAGCYACVRQGLRRIQMACKRNDAGGYGGKR